MAPHPDNGTGVVVLKSGAVAVSLCGTLDAASVAELPAQLSRLARSGYTRVVIDLRDVESADSAGLAALVSGLEVMRGAGGDLQLAAPRPAVRTVIQMTELDRVFNIHETVDAAFR